MRYPTILDVVRAITAIAESHPQVAVWWYAPSERFRLRGRLEDSGERKPLEVVVELEDEASVDWDRIGQDLSDRLWDNPVAVRPHRGREAESRLIRVLSNSDATRV